MYRYDQCCRGFGRFDIAERPYIDLEALHHQMAEHTPHQARAVAFARRRRPPQPRAATASGVADEGTRIGSSLDHLYKIKNVRSEAWIGRRRQSLRTPRRSRLTTCRLRASTPCGPDYWTPSRAR